MKSAESKQKKKEEIGMKEEKVFIELGAAPPDKLFKVVRCFWLNVVVGPLVPVPVGATVQLTKELAETLFFGSRIEPLGDLASEFEVVRHFVVTTASGEWLFLRPGDLVSMGREEGLQEMRNQNIRERRME